jgi:hypothetical protein
MISARTLALASAIVSTVGAPIGAPVAGAAPPAETPQQIIVPAAAPDPVASVVVLEVNGR